MTEQTSLNIIALPGIPLVKTGDNLTALIIAALERANLQLKNGDILVISSKIVSKAEGRIIDLQTVTPGEEAHRVAEETRKDPRIVELVLQESTGISRRAPNILVTRHRLGFVSANAGIDQSNVGEGGDHVLLLPLDPDWSASQLRTELEIATSTQIGIVISDSHGRPFRMGNVGVAVGVAGIPAVVDLRGQHDLFGRELRVSTQGFADLIASAAHLLCGEGDEGRPVILIRGLQYEPFNGRASELYRPQEQDLYR